MANLEAKNKMSAIQLGVVIASTGLGMQLLLASRKTVADSGHLAWLSVIVGGLIFCGSALLMVKLGEQYPDSTLVEYMPQLWGRWGGSIIIWWFNILFLVQVSNILAGLSKAIALFMFDRTPNEVIALSMLVVCVYYALQDWGTFLRVQQILFFIAVPLFTMIWLLSILNFQPENVLPLWSKQDLPGSIKASVWDTYGVYNGYELILFLLPSMARGKVSASQAVRWSFGCMGLIFFSIIVLAVGVLTTNGVKNALYPTMTVISSVEVPGTFIERLDTYLVTAWIPVVFDTLAIYLWLPTQVLRQYCRYADHRPLVLAFVPLLYCGSVLLNSMKLSELSINFVNIIGLILSLGIIPLSLVLVWWKKRSHITCRS